MGLQSACGTAAGRQGRVSSLFSPLFFQFFSSSFPFFFAFEFFINAVTLLLPSYSLSNFFIYLFHHLFFSFLIIFSCFYIFFRVALIEAVERHVLLPENALTLYPVFRVILQLLYDEGESYNSLLFISTIVHHPFISPIFYQPVTLYPCNSPLQLLYNFYSKNSM